MLTCREVCEQAQDYTDKKVSVVRRLRIGLHLMMCRNCTGFVDQTNQTKHLLGDSLTRHQDTSVSPDIMAAFLNQKTPPENDTPDRGA